MPEPIDPYKNERVFTVNYEISAEVTVDIEFSQRESTTFYDQDCGQGKACSLIEAQECKFEANYDISCSRDKKNITAFINELPK
jgi:hypothetical protein